MTQELYGVLCPDPAPIFYRLYHDDQGRPLFYSMEDLPGTYIEISQEQYAASSTRVRVMNGKLVPKPWRMCEKLVPSDHGAICHSEDVAVVAKQGKHWIKRTYETD